jgi:ring-1,2-phenylacetyl-CoA epoxidase subunit PaaC
MSHPSELFSYALCLADDALVLGHRLSQWSSRAPTLEEDIALSNLALDLIGQARLLYTLAGKTEGKGQTEDDLAYFRGPDEFRNILLVELPNGDFAQTMVRQLLYSAFVHPFFEALSASRHTGLAEIAAKAVKEMAYHVRHSAEWVIRLGDGTEESRRRTVAALAELWPYTAELFETDAAERQLVSAAIAVDRAALRPRWDQTIDHVLREAGLERPQVLSSHSGGRSGRHTPHLAEMLADMQVLARAHPGATW